MYRHLVESNGISSDLIERVQLPVLLDDTSKLFREVHQEDNGDLKKLNALVDDTFYGDEDSCEL